MPIVPQQYQKLSQNRASKLAQIPRTTFKRKFWDSGVLSLNQDQLGNDYVTFDELYRVFGEILLESIKAETSGHVQYGHLIDQNSDLVEMDIKNDLLDMHIRLENERLKAEKEGMENLVHELREQLKRERDRLEITEQKQQKIELQYKALLEDRNHYENQEHRLIEVQKQQELLEEALWNERKKKLVAKTFWFMTFISHKPKVSVETL